LTSSSC